MSNLNPKTEHLKPTEFKRKRPDRDDHSTMIDMIKSGTNVEAFMLFWHNEAGYTLQSARTMFYELKRRV